MPNNTIIDFSDNGAVLNVRNRQLIVEIPDSGEKTSVFLGDIAVILISHQATVISHSVLTGIAEYGGILVACGANYMPMGLYIPCVGNGLQTERTLLQVAASTPTLKRAWQQIVQAKLRMQAQLLEDVIGKDAGLYSMALQVNSGDVDNKEAQAAKRYWRYLFGENFRRDPALNDSINVCLNYGYAVIRAIVAKAVIATGLHPSFGLFHRNRYNPFCLADDLMEPFRPVVDREVFRLHQNRVRYNELTKELKKSLVEAVKTDYYIADKCYSIFDASLQLAQSLVVFYSKTGTQLCIFTSCR